MRTVWLIYSFVVVGEILNIEINANPGFLYQIYMSPYRTRYLNAGGVEVEFEPGSCSDTPSCSAPARSHSNLLASSPLPPLTALLHQSEHHYVALSASSGHQTIDLCVPPRPRALTGRCASEAAVPPPA